jgi:hypothetical protein
VQSRLFISQNQDKYLLLLYFVVVLLLDDELTLRYHFLLSLCSAFITDNACFGAPWDMSVMLERRGTANIGDEWY